MKTLLALLSIVLLAGCYKNNPDPNSPFGGGPGGGQQSPTSVGFTKHAWCYAYQNGPRMIQDRFYFNDGGSLDYREYDWLNGQRGKQTFTATGTWSLSGTVLNMDVNGSRLVYQINYAVKDPLTGRERLHIYMNGDDATYDPCF